MTTKTYGEMTNLELLESLQKNLKEVERIRALPVERHTYTFTSPSTGKEVVHDWLGSALAHASIAAFVLEDNLKGA